MVTNSTTCPDAINDSFFIKYFTITLVKSFCCTKLVLLHNNRSIAQQSFYCTIIVLLHIRMIINTPKSQLVYRFIPFIKQFHYSIAYFT